MRVQCIRIDKDCSKDLIQANSHDDDLETDVINDGGLDDIKQQSIEITDEIESIKLSCGHGIMPHCKTLYEYCMEQISKGQTELKCLQCNDKLELSMIKNKFLTDKQVYEIEKGLTRNNFLSDPERLKECPYCGLFIENNGTNIKVTCPICKEVFCWKCTTNWNATSHKDCETAQFKCCLS